MSPLWYYENHGKAIGPISLRDLIHKIEKSELTLMDLVFKEGGHQWQPAERFSEITELIGNVTVESSADWIVLRATTASDGKVQQEQIGPFNAQQILDFLDKGQVRFSDYVWRVGYDKWVPLGRVDQFEKPLKSSIKVDMSLYSKPRLPDFVVDSAPVKKMSIQKLIQPLKSDEPKPKDAKGEDLATPKWALPQLKSKRTQRLQVSLDSDSAQETKKVQKTPLEKHPDETTAVKPALPTVTTTIKSKEETAQKKIDREEVLASASPTTIDEHAESLKQKPLSKDRVEEKEHRTEVKGNSKKSKKTAPPRPKVERQYGLLLGVFLCCIIIVLAFGLLIFAGKKRIKNSKEKFSFKIEKPHADIVKAQRLKSNQVQNQKPQTSSDAKNFKEKTNDGASQLQAPTAIKVENISAKPGKVAEELEPVGSGSFKEKSYYHQKERMYLFYTAIEGETLAKELQKGLENSKTKKNFWKKFYMNWKSSAKSYLIKVTKEAKKARLHKTLFARLNSAADDIWDLGLELNSQVSGGKNISKGINIKDLEIQFRSIQNSAKTLDQ